MSTALQLFLSIFSRALMLFLVLPITNSARGLVAKWMGDDTAEVQGRITLNPMAHLDLLGSLAIMLCGFGWSKPLPINFNRMRDTRKGILLISLTGPVTHFISAIILMNLSEILSRVLTYSTTAFAVVYIISALAGINICLGVINLIPVPPMDGFNILNHFAPPKFHNWYFRNYRQINQWSTIILLALFFLPRLTFGLLDPLGWVISLVQWVLNLTTLWIPLVFH
ncbi:MAG: site-2 protease family protein [Ruminococcus flavefaciens]|nr:site-2 protease family protein [Ruminococcus flavefaciens]MCM1229096.1 site-2 protease family protein [Ruminococcus flavefaciens]